MWAEWILRSYLEQAGEPLWQGGPAELDAAPLVVLAHDGAEDPRFTFANDAALRLFGYTADEFIGMPSRLSAEPEQRDARARMLARAQGSIIRDYEGIRVAKDGSRFLISRVAVWPLTDEHGIVVGQAAAFSEWQPLDPAAQ